MIDYIIRGNAVTAYFNYNNVPFSLFVDSYIQDYHWRVSACNALRKYFKTDVLDDFFDGIVREVIADKTNFVGKAKCHPDDEFDAEIGKELAKKRLLDNFHKFIDRCIKKAKARLNEIPYINKHIKSEHYAFDFVRYLASEADEFIFRRSLLLGEDY